MLGAIGWVVRERGSGTREVLEDFASKQGLVLDDLKLSLILPSNEAVRHAVEAGAGATVISERVVARSLDEGALRHVPLVIPTRDFAMITNGERQPNLAHSALGELLRNKAGTQTNC